MTSGHRSSIADFFDYKNRNTDGSFSMYQWTEDPKDRLYILNCHHKKLLQFVVKNEPKITSENAFAQIKIIPYGIERAKIYRDQQNDPNLQKIDKGLELTYHGGPKDERMPKVQLKVISTSKLRYKTLVDCSLSLENDTPRLVPICSLFPGYDFDNPLTEKVKKKSHTFIADSTHPVRFDIYFSGKNFDHHAYMTSMYSINMFFSLDYLIENKGGPLQGLPIVQPIKGFAMRDYYFWVRCSKSIHQGKPFIQFYNNAKYYQKFMSRRTASVDNNGRIHWSTMVDEEKKITAFLGNKKSKANKGLNADQAIACGL